MGRWLGANSYRGYYSRKLENVKQKVQWVSLILGPCTTIEKSKLAPSVSKKVTWRGFDSERTRCTGFRVFRTRSGASSVYDPGGWKGRRYGYFANCAADGVPKMRQRLVVPVAAKGSSGEDIVWGVADTSLPLQ